MSHSFFIAPIVEGHGEVQAVPILLRRIAEEAVPDALLQINPALRVKAGSFINDAEYFNKYVEIAARKARQAREWPQSCILVLLDCEDHCPAELGPEISKRAQTTRPDVPTITILAHREYETWFLAAARSLRGADALPSDVDPPANPESIRNAKGWLSTRMKGPYIETEHQPKFTSRFLFEEAKTIDSFRRCVQKLRDFFQPKRG